MTKGKTKPITQHTSPTSSRIWLSPEMQEHWQEVADELYAWLKDRFDKPLEGISFLHFATAYFEKQHGFRYTGTEQVEEHQT